MNKNSKPEPPEGRTITESSGLSLLCLMIAVMGVILLICVG
jgi:hypothetical protein